MEGHERDHSLIRSDGSGLLKFARMISWGIMRRHSPWGSTFDWEDIAQSSVVFLLEHPKYALGPGLHYGCLKAIRKHLQVKRGDIVPHQNEWAYSNEAGVVEMLDASLLRTPLPGVHKSGSIYRVQFSIEGTDRSARAFRKKYIRGFNTVEEANEFRIRWEDWSARIFAG